MTPRRGPLPLLLGAATFVVVALLLWPTEEPMRTLVVAARDLGAGTLLATLPAAQAPADAVDDPALLAGQTLGVVRFAGEPVTLRHLGETVTLAPDERGIAVRVTADTGLAGLLRPGMQVGVVATLPQEDEGLFAKALRRAVRTLGDLLFALPAGSAAMQEAAVGKPARIWTLGPIRIKAS